MGFFLLYEIFNDPAMGGLTNNFQFLNSAELKRIPELFLQAVFKRL
jgi:hypothetical protein